MLQYLWVLSLIYDMFLDPGTPYAIKQPSNSHSLQRSLTCIRSACRIFSPPVMISNQTEVMPASSYNNWRWNSCSSRGAMVNVNFKRFGWTSRPRWLDQSGDEIFFFYSWVACVPQQGVLESPDSPCESDQSWWQGWKVHQAVHRHIHENRKGVFGYWR